MDTIEPDENNLEDRESAIDTAHSTSSVSGDEKDHVTIKEPNLVLGDDKEDVRHFRSRQRRRRLLRHAK